MPSYPISWTGGDTLEIPDHSTVESSPYTIGGLLGQIVPLGEKLLDRYDAQKSAKNAREAQAELAQVQGANWGRIALIGGGVILAAVVLWKILK